MMEVMDVIQTSEVNGASKSISSVFAYFECAIALFRKYAPALDSSMATRITKIHTSSSACVVGLFTASKMNVIRATPVTP